MGRVGQGMGGRRAGGMRKMRAGQSDGKEEGGQGNEKKEGLRRRRAG